jgi:hypothetical protein
MVKMDELVVTVSGAAAASRKMPSAKKAVSTITSEQKKPIAATRLGT